MSDKFTKEQQAALDADGRVIVSASAGSGKTTVMIEKIIRLIQAGDLRVDELLAVTFTKKAAAQMKEKLAEALISALNSDGIDEERRKTLKEQLAEVPNADISTIHSFCAKLIRTHFFAANVENTFRVIGGDDAEGVALKNEALDELLNEGYESKDEQCAQLLALYWRKKSDNTLRKIITETYEKLRNRADYREYLSAIKGYDEQKFDDVCADLYALFTQKCRYYLDGLETERIFFGDGQSAQQKLLDELTAWVKEMLAAPDYFALAKVEKLKFTPNRKTKSMSAECLMHVERLSFLKDRLVKAFESEFEKLLSREEELAAFIRSGETAQALAVYLLRFDEKYEELKKERGVLDYNDLEHKALALLKDETLAAEVREKYKRVFVDEYQDVNPVQEEIISRLSDENLFLVGDVKQSIYGFRGSKSRFFVEKQRAFENGAGQSLKMTRNFRSSDKVLDAVNAQFSVAMTPQVCDVDYARDSFMERGGLYPLGDGRVQVHFFGKDEKETAAARGVYSVRDRAEKNTVEPTSVAKMIRQIIDDERRLTIYDVKRQAYRPVEYSDIAILSRKKKGQIAKTVAALAAEDIPVTTATAVNICEYAEVKTLIDILSLIDNAEQDIPLCSALLSAMGGLTADELTEIRLAYKNEIFFRRACLQYAAEQTDRIAGKLKKFYTYFESLRTRAHLLSAGEILTLLISETGMERDLLSRENGTSCMRRVHRFIEETSTEESLSVHDFLDRLRDLDYEIEFCEGGGDDSVKVLTMHSSKGLEYPVVILDNLSADFRGGDHEEVYVEEKYGLAPRAFDEQKMVKSTTRLRRLHEVKETESSVLDELNLYYVALTRAKYALHMLFEKPTSMSDVKYARSFAEFTDFSVWKEYFAADEIFDVPKLERQALEYHPDPTLVRSIMDAYQWQYAYAGCENLPVKSSATQLITGGVENGAFAEGHGVGFGKVIVSDEEFERIDGADDEMGADVSDMNGLSTRSSCEKAQAEGVAYHAFLERFDFGLLWDEQGEPISKECLTCLIEERLSAFAREDEKACALLDKVQLTEILSNSVFYQLRGMRLYKEQQFLATLPIKDTYAKRLGAESGLSERAANEEMIFQGAIDLLAVDEMDGRVRIVDYKYSTHDGEYLRERYGLQLELYRLATAKILKIDPSKIECAIVNIRRGFQVDID